MITLKKCTECGCGFFPSLQHPAVCDSCHMENVKQEAMKKLREAVRDYMATPREQRRFRHGSMRFAARMARVAGWTSEEVDAAILEEINKGHGGTPHAP